MFAEKSDKLVKKLIQAEFQNACDHYGMTYDSLDEAEKILIEEINEADTEVEELDLRFSDTDWIEGKNLSVDLNKMQKRAINGIKELAQVCAVINKIRLSNLGK